MKKQTFSKIRKSAGIMFLAGILSIATLSVQAQETPKPLATNLDIRYIGSLQGQPVFHVQFENTREENLSVAIRDEDGTLIYNEKFNDKKFSKKFKFENGAVDPLKLKFTLTGEKEKYSQAFEIYTNFRMIQDVTVTRL